MEEKFKRYFLILFTSLVLSSNQIVASESQKLLMVSTLNVDIQKNDYDVYIYNYELVNPKDSNEVIDSLKINLRCQKKAMPDRKNELLGIGTSAAIAIKADDASRKDYDINSDQVADWNIRIRPGESKKFSLFSKMSPVKRQFEINPINAKNKIDPDFVTKVGLNGMTKGPGCNKGELPESILFSGDLYNKKDFKESYAENLLLQYSIPTHNQIIIDSDSDYLEFKIHYAEDLNVSSFKAILSSDKDNEITNLFNPVPGHFENVKIPLNNNKNLEFKLEGTNYCDELKDCSQSNIQPLVDRDRFLIMIKE